VNLSCYIRTLNEEKRLAHVLQAVGHVSDDIVVVDSGSSDKTIEIAQAHGARVIEQAWLGNGFQKRVGEQACKHDWVLDLDADEILTTELITQIQQVLARKPNIDEVFGLRLITVPPYGKPWYHFAIDERHKLYNRQFVQMPEHKAWDQLELPMNTKTTTLHGDLLHYSFSGIAQMSDKWNKVSSRRVEGDKLKSRPSVMLRVVFAGPFYFFKNYVLKGLWRAGLYGFAIAVVGAHGRWLRDVKMLERHMEKQGKKNTDFE
jgi:Glycosyltransferases involved in cell wall biogenesis